MVFTVFFLLFSLLLSCSGSLGYGVLLWNETSLETVKGLDNGQIVTIIRESKVHKSYIISFENKELSIETSRIKFFRHLPNAEEYRKQFMKYQHWYAINMKPSGLVMRSAPKRKAEQVYRLRPQQMVKILGLASGQVSLGNIKGHWYEALTEDGVRGFAFDYYLRIENRLEAAEQQVVKFAAFEQKQDELKIDLNSLAGIWYDKKYTRSMRSGQNIDLRLLMLPHGQLYLNPKNSRLELYLDRLPQASQIIPYEKFTVDSSAELNFDNGQIRAIFVRADEVSFYFQNKKQEETILELQQIGQEELERHRQQALARRKTLLAAIFRDGSQFSASKIYGSIRFQPNGQFAWSNTIALTDQGILQSSPNKGTLFFAYQLGPRLQKDYNSLLTFVFRDNQELTFLLKMERSDILLRYVPPFMIDAGNTLNSDAFNKKLEIQMQLEGRPMIPVDLF